VTLVATCSSKRTDNPTSYGCVWRHLTSGSDGKPDRHIIILKRALIFECERRHGRACGHESSQAGCWQISSQKPVTGRASLAASITRAGIWREVSEFVRLPLPLLRVRRGRFFDRNIWPDSCVFRIQRQPFLKPGFAISLDGIDGAFRFANATVDAFVRMDDEHVLALVEAVHGAHLDAVHGFAANAAIVDDVGQLVILPADCRGQLMCAIVGLAGRLKMDAQKIYVLWLNRSAEQ